MFRRKLAAALFALALAVGVGACGTEADTGAPDTDAGPGNSAEEDPTLGDAEGGDDMDGGDEGTTPNSATDSGSGTGAGRGDG